jgi:glycosyltransferase involved in cell wall biosynthesis
MRVAFLMEQHLGHRTFYQNLRRFVSVDRRIEPRWVEVSYYQPGGRLERSPLLPAGLKGTLRGIQQAREGLAAFPVDAAFTNSQVPAAFLLDRMKSLPCIVSTDITPLQYDAMAEPYHHRPDRPGLVRAVKHRLNRLVFQRAALVVAWSDWVRRSLIADYGVADDHIRVIPPGIDLEIWSPDAATDCDAQFGGANRPVRILFVGGDFVRKGGDVLLNAFRALGQTQVELHLVTREMVPHIAGMHIYHGMQLNSPELIQLYRQSDLFVLPSLAEAFGIAAIEALACGLPVIASRVGGLVDVVEDGVNGWLVPAGDAQALAQTIQQTIAARSTWPALRRQARRMAEQRFDARRNAERCVALLLECAR